MNVGSDISQARAAIDETRDCEGDPPRQLPSPEEEALLRLEEELKDLQAHSLAEHCEHSLWLSRKYSHPRVFIGYAVIPGHLHGVCHDKRLN